MTQKPNSLLGSVCHETTTHPTQHSPEHTPPPESDFGFCIVSRIKGEGAICDAPYLADAVAESTELLACELVNSLQHYKIGLVSITNNFQRL